MNFVLNNFVLKIKLEFKIELCNRSILLLYNNI